MSVLEDIIANGNRRPFREGGRRANGENEIDCADGFTLSVIAGEGTYCEPRPGRSYDVEDTYPGPYTAVEVGFPSDRPEPWEQWKEFCEDPDRPTDTVYGYVPVDVVRVLVESHGGESTVAP